MDGLAGSNTIRLTWRGAIRNEVFAGRSRPPLRPDTAQQTWHSTSMSLSVKNLYAANGATISFELAVGQCLSISGPSGSGKSLLLRALADLDPHTGSVAFEGIEKSQFTAPDWRRRVMYLPPSPGFWRPRLADHLLDAEPRPERVDLAPDRVSAPISQLSTGEQQRGALIRALQRKPRVLLADEPSSALDPKTTAMVEDLLTAFLSDGGTLVLVTHDPDQAKRLATDHIALGAPWHRS